MASDPKQKRLYIVTVDFEFPAMLTEEEARRMNVDHLARDAMSDLGDSPIDRIALCGPTYRMPDGYDSECLVYGADKDTTWGDAVAEDKAALAAKEKEA